MINKELLQKVKDEYAKTINQPYENRGFENWDELMNFYDDSRVGWFDKHYDKIAYLFYEQLKQK